MSAKTFLSVEAWTVMEKVLPLERWFCKQREGLGYEAWTYAMIRVSRAQTILQWGFDETKLDGVSTMNQWVLLQEGDHAPEVVTIEAAGLTVGGTAERTAEHVRKSWELGPRDTHEVIQHPAYHGHYKWGTYGARWGSFLVIISTQGT